MTETLKPELYDKRREMRIEMADIPYIKRVCKVFDVKYQTVATEGQVYASGAYGNIVLPDGYAWIKMRGNFEANHGFDFVIDLAKDIKALDETSH